MTKQELERQIEKLNSRIKALEQNNTELASHNRILKNVTQAMLLSVHGKQLNILEPHLNQTDLREVIGGKIDIARSKHKLDID